MTTTDPSPTATAPGNPGSPRRAVTDRRASRIHAVTLHPRTLVTLAIVSLISVAAFGWPLLAAPTSDAVAHSGDAPLVFALLLPLLIAVVWAEIADGLIDTKALAVLGVLAAVGTALRPIGGGIAGLEPVWVLIIIGGRALGPGFGFTLGSVTLISSALITGGVGPWLPFQMIAAGWVGFGAGLLPRVRSRRGEVLLLAGYAALACVAYGFLMNLWFWPFSGGMAAQLSYQAGAPMLVNLQHWLVFSLATSLGYDIPRAVLTATLILVAGAPILGALRRATRRAAFGAPVVFVEAQ